RKQIEAQGADKGHDATTSVDGWMIQHHEHGHGKTLTNSDGRTEIDTEHGRLARNKDGQWQFTEGSLVQNEKGEWVFKAKEGGRVEKWQTFEEMKKALNDLP